MQQKKLNVNRSQLSSEPKLSLSWQAPPAATVKLNVDASVYEGASCYSLGLVLRDHQGAFLRGRTICVNGAASVF